MCHEVPEEGYKAGAGVRGTASNGIRAVMCVHYGSEFFYNKKNIMLKNLQFECITDYIYTYQLRCTKRGVLMSLNNFTHASAIVAKSAIHGCLQLSRHPCRLWLYFKKSHKNNYASPKSRDIHKYNMIYI